MKFIDEVTIEVASGHGGPGAVSFRREKYVPRGGPDGGDGGRGGHIIFRVSTRLHSLLDLRLQKKYRADDGEKGSAQNKNGRSGSDLVLEVPPGTILKTVSGELINDLGDSKEDYIFLKGGLGGKGNSFYKTSVNQAPSVAQKGLPGETVAIKVELKLIADVGIIGFPNVGKSTLISHISAAKPKIADYPFTTLTPNLGVVRYEDDLSFVVADIPGLIKGAHAGQGLGIRFLKHIERTKIFVHLIDASGMSQRDPIEDYHDINEELSCYDRDREGEDGFIPLSSRPQIVVLNKVDVCPKAELESLVKKFKKMEVDVMSVSAATGENLQKLIYKLGDIIFNEQKN